MPDKQAKLGRLAVAGIDALTSLEKVSSFSDLVPIVRLAAATLKTELLADEDFAALLASHTPTANDDTAGATQAPAAGEAGNAPAGA